MEEFVNLIASKGNHHSKSIGRRRMKENSSNEEGSCAAKRAYHFIPDFGSGGKVGEQTNTITDYKIKASQVIVCNIQH